MYRISCFADEISANLNEQVAVMKTNSIHYVELRSIWDKNVLDLSNEELRIAKEEFSNNGIQVSSIGSPIGKVDIEDDFDEHLDRFNRAVEVAKKMDTKNIRIFSFYLPKEKLDIYRDRVIERLKIMVEIAEKNGLTLLHENEADIYGESSKRCLDLFQSIPSASFGAVFDPSNFVIAGEDVFYESFNNLQSHIEYIHIKDSLKDTREIVVAGHGDGQIPEILHRLKSRKDMFISLEPHLAQAGKYKGFTGSLLFGKALGALKEILEALGIDYE